MEDIFDGAVGIDLGTTYSYVSDSMRLPMENLTALALQLRWCLAKRSGGDHRQRPYVCVLYELFHRTYVPFRG